MTGREPASQKSSPREDELAPEPTGGAIAPVQVAPFTAWCVEKLHEADSADARAEYAAHLAAHADPALITWPPDRNQPCWCGSGRKYKKCCAAPTSVDAEPHR